jgi:hypothetical protein
VRQAVDRIVELGLVDARVPGQRLDTELDENLDYFGRPDHQAVLRLLGRLGIVYEVDYEPFSHVCEDGLEVYRPELECVAAASRGRITITDIELVDDDVAGDGGEHVLRFRCNGAVQEWRIAHSEDIETEDFEAQLTFGFSVDTLTPAGSPERWCTVTSDGGPLSLVFADPHALSRLGEQFGLALAES